MLDDLHGLRPARKHFEPVLKRRAHSWHSAICKLLNMIV
jgi:hypothetical protein